MTYRIPEYQEAKEVVIEIEFIYEKLKRAFETIKENSPKEYDGYFGTIADKLQDKFFFWEVIKVGEGGRLSEEAIEILRRHLPRMVNPLDIWSEMRYRVSGTKPEGKVQITPKTKVFVKPIFEPRASK